MPLYSDFGPRRTRQITADVLALVFIALCVSFGVTVYGLVSNLSSFGVRMVDAGRDFQTTMTEISETIGRTPIVGSALQGPFQGASEAGAALQSAGESQQVAVQQLAVGLGIGIAVLPILLVLLFWLIPRIRFVQGSNRARAMMRSGSSVDLLALRALSTQRMSTLATIDPDVVGAWRRGDQDVMRALAGLELKSAGVRLRE